MTALYPQTQPNTQVQPLFWQEVVAAAVALAVITVLSLWVFQQFKKVTKGEEIERPFR